MAATESEMKEFNKPEDRLLKVMLALHSHSEITIRSYLVLIYIFSLLGYIGIFFGLLAVNFKDQEFIETEYYKPFHLLAFWSVFVFTVIEAFIMILAKLATKSPFQFILLGFNIIASLMTAILFTMDPEEYEVVSHYLEYSIQIFISAVNALFVFNVMRRKDNSTFYRYRYFELLVVFLVMLLSVFQLFFYSGLITTGIEAERTAHFCEFANEIVNGFFALWYACIVFVDIRRELRRCRDGMHQV